MQVRKKKDDDEKDVSDGGAEEIVSIGGSG